MAKEAKRQAEDDLEDQLAWDQSWVQAVQELEAELAATEFGRAIVRSARALEAKVQATTNSRRAA